MADHDSFTATWAPRALSILRIAAAFLLIQHGTQKLFSYPPAPPPPTPPAAQQQNAQQPAAQQPPKTPVYITVAGVLEFFGCLLLLLGLFTRPVSFILSGLLAVAYFMAHAPQGFWPVVNRGELAALYSFVFLYLAAAGGGAWSLDRLIRRDRTP